MTYAMAGDLQGAVWQHLLADPSLNALVGTAIYDALPLGTIPETYVSIGAETVRDRSDISGTGAEHRFTISVISEVAGFAHAKAVAGAVGDALLHHDLTLERGRMVGLWFERATARRTGSAGRVRRIDLRFRARVEDDQAV
ncbi:DUF3168 domain-containing protein [Pontibaca salina]|uniref:DUF3168 domain-containing protein n=1 Tax=Pontibaca salina TaxID=2795731 RepID=A0A934M0W7_9RHOB|nr:DUF3168 domain-containing protein [Pontibaca salina]MBI6630430.1 DUF3168 domain-containing protein [Pontibaca salina]